MQFRGNIYWEGELREGEMIFQEGSYHFEEGRIGNPDSAVTFIPAPINGHTHIGDSFIHAEPMGSIPEVVGPGGFKHEMLKNVTDAELSGGIRKSLSFMKSSGTATFFDFREGGISGVRILSALSGDMQPVILGRTTDGDEDPYEVLRECDGFGFSAVSDDNLDHLMKCASASRSVGKIVSTHFSEDVPEDLDMALDLSPDFLVHCLECSPDVLDVISRRKIYVAITPRSNAFFGKNPDYSRFLEHGIRLFLGTDNVMVSEPDLFSEMNFLYLHQKRINRISPEDILKMTLEYPRKFLSKFRKITPSFLLTDSRLSPYEIVNKGHMHSWRFI